MPILRTILLVLGVCSCKQKHGNPEIHAAREVPSLPAEHIEEHLAVWRSSQSSLEEKRLAVLALVPEGMKMKEAKAILGNDSFSFRSSGEDESVYGIAYQCSRGTIALLIREPSGEWWEEGEFTGKCVWREDPPPNEKESSEHSGIIQL